MCTGPYEIPNVKVDAYSVYTNRIPGGAFRGFGGPQAAFAAESQMNKLAEALGMDPVELRMKNLLSEGSLLSVGTPLPPGVSIGKVVEACADRAGWERKKKAWRKPDKANLGESGAPHLRRGIGFACGFKNVGFSFGFPEQSTATIELHGRAEIEKVILHHAGAEVGQGAHTVMAQMAAEATRVPIEKVQLVVSDTAFTQDSGSASASRMTFMAGNTIRGAADAALEKWRLEERPAVATFQYRPPATTSYDPQTGKSEPNFAYGYVGQAVTVEVDIETGHIRVLNVVCANDVGRAVNPQLVQGQIEGAIVQAAGYVLMEDFQQADGYVQTAHLSTYLIPTILDIPENVESVILEYPDQIGPWGVRGMGEMPYIPVAPAIIAAVQDAVGIWFDEFPLTPVRVIKHLREAGVH
jgi:CO/xanthine dehydrogenase Mo-binding subunit